jgi:hypothetical protein
MSRTPLDTTVQDSHVKWGYVSPERGLPSGHVVLSNRFRCGCWLPQCVGSAPTISYGSSACIGTAACSTGWGHATRVRGRTASIERVTITGTRRVADAYGGALMPREPGRAASRGPHPISAPQIEETFRPRRGG